MTMNTDRMPKFNRQNAAFLLITNLITAITFFIWGEKRKEKGKTEAYKMGVVKGAQKKDESIARVDEKLAENHEKQEEIKNKFHL